MTTVQATTIYTLRKPTTEATYVSSRASDFQKARELYKKHRAVRYSETDKWVMIGGIVINGISKKDMERIIKETETEMENNHDNI